MKIKTILGAARKFAMYGIFMGPLPPRFGGGWIGILAGGTIRGLVFAVGYALLLYMLNTWSLFKWSTVAFAFLLYSYAFEMITSRRKHQ